MPIRSILLTVTLLSIFRSGAQFYPDSSAAWCSLAIGPPDAGSVLHYMGASPDTNIVGESYKVIKEYSDANSTPGMWEYVRSYYVRSDADGKGYAYLLDSLAEYLTGDTAAIAGDTLHNVLGWYDGYWGQCGLHSQEYALFDVAVDSVVTYSNNGVTVHRQFVSLPCPNEMVPNSHMVFWQAGMGTSFGPMLRIGVALGSNIELVCASASGVEQLTPAGMPCCWPITIAGVPMMVQRAPLMAHPNPSVGRFALDLTGALDQAIVFDPQGREVLRTHERSIDLTGHAPGLYTAVVTTEQGRQAVRLVLQRE